MCSKFRIYIHYKEEFLFFFLHIFTYITLKITDKYKEKFMNYGTIKKVDIANGLGVRSTLFCSGCTHHCNGCFQPQTWDFNYGNEFTKETEDEIIESLKPYYIDGLTLLGGEPFEPENREVLLSLVKRVKAELPDKTIWAYSGYSFNQLIGKENARCGNAIELLSQIDVLVDGEFVADKKNISLRFRGSSNQRIIDVKKSLEKNYAIPYESKKEGIIGWNEEKNNENVEDQER